jgi:histone arginine demethylase JMJD6
MYMFEPSVENLPEAKNMIENYSVPKFFKEDLLAHIGNKNRPPYRWFLVGPERSGSKIHIDPLDTSAWNTSLHGYKRWVLFPPRISKDTVKAKKFIHEGEDNYAIQYFTRILPRLIESEGREKLGKHTLYHF